MPGSRAASRVAETLERHRFVILAILSVAFFYSASIRAAAKPFWHDEIYTILLTGLPSLSTMWAAMQDGMDLAPPLNAVLTRVVRWALGVGPIVTRLVPMISIWAAMLVLFAMVRRRANATAALTAAMLPMFTAAYRHSYEARAYGLMVALFAFAVYAWAEAAAGRYRTRNLAMLAISLGAGLWNHYYAVLAYLPILAGEAVRTWRTRRLDPGVLGAVAGSVILASPLLVLLKAASGQTSAFWSPASPDDIAEAYRFVFEPLLDIRFLLAGGVVLALSIAGFIDRHTRQYSEQSLPLHEVAAIVAALLVPLAGVLIGLLLTGVFVPRYALPAVVGASLAVPIAVWRFSGRFGIAELVLPIVFVVSLVEFLRPVVRVPDPVESRPLLVDSLKTAGPTAVTGGLTYLQLWYYTPAALKSRIVYIADPESARRYTGSDTIDLGFLALSRWTAVNVVPLETFVARQAEFRVYAYGSGWLLDKLRDADAATEELGTEASARLFVVRLRR